MRTPPILKEESKTIPGSKSQKKSLGRVYKGEMGAHLSTVFGAVYLATVHFWPKLALLPNFDIYSVERMVVFKYSEIKHLGVYWPVSLKNLLSPKRRRMWKGHSLISWSATCLTNGPCGALLNSTWNYNSHETTTFECPSSTHRGPKVATTVKRRPKWQRPWNDDFSTWPSLRGKSLHSQRPPSHNNCESTAVKWRLLQHRATTAKCNDREVTSLKLHNCCKFCVRFCVASWLLSFQVPFGSLWTLVGPQKMHRFHCVKTCQVVRWHPFHAFTVAPRLQKIKKAWLPLQKLVRVNFFDFPEPPFVGNLLRPQLDFSDPQAKRLKHFGKEFPSRTFFVRKSMPRDCPFVPSFVLQTCHLNDFCNKFGHGPIDCAVQPRSHPCEQPHLATLKAHGRCADTPLPKWYAECSKHPCDVGVVCQT